MDLDSLLTEYPALNQFLSKASKIERLGGLTNQNYLVHSDQGDCVVRIPGKGTESYLNREVEYSAANLTSELGVNAPVIYFDPKTGLQVTRFIKNAATMDATSFKNPEAISRAARSFQRVHSSQIPFKSRFELFAMVDNYLELLSKTNQTLPEGFERVLKQSFRVRKALDLHHVILVPCHCDPLAENFIDTGEKMYLIDWEYSGNNDPMWDLGDLSVEAGFSKEQDEHLLDSYFNGNVNPFDQGRMILFKAMCDLLWTLWGVIQHANGNNADDFWAYANTRLARCKSLMEQPEFEKALQAVERGPNLQ